MASRLSFRAFTAPLGRVGASTVPRTTASGVPMTLRKAAKTVHGQQFLRPISSTRSFRKEADLDSGIPPAKTYSFQEVADISSSPASGQILIDVREPSELLQTGRIPGAKSVPISSAPDAFFMSPEDFEAKFGFPRPSEQDEVIFYCRSGVRSRQAALFAGQARPMFGGKLANYTGSWLDWEKNGGKAEREGDQPGSDVSGVTSTGGVPPAARP